MAAMSSSESPSRCIINISAPADCQDLTDKIVEELKAQPGIEINVTPGRQNTYSATFSVPDHAATPAEKERAAAARQATKDLFAQVMQRNMQKLSQSLPPTVA